MYLLLRIPNTEYRMSVRDSVCVRRPVSCVLGMVFGIRIYLIHCFNGYRTNHYTIYCRIVSVPEAPRQHSLLSLLIPPTLSGSERLVVQPQPNEPCGRNHERRT